MLNARKAVVVATGSGAAMPPIDGLDGVEAWNNRQATTAKQVPESMIVLGGGPVGSELSQAWSSLGTRVTLVEGGERLLSREEPFAGEEVAESLRERFGVDVRTGVLAEQVARRLAPASSPSSATAARSRERRSWSRSAAPPTPPTSASRAPGSKPASTASSRRTTGCGSAVASGSTRSATSTAAPSSPTSASTRPGSRPRTCSAATSRRWPRASARPESPSPTRRWPLSGKTLDQAREAGIDARAVDVPTDGSAGASFQGKGTGGTSRIVVDQADGTIVGATFTGFETADFLHAATVAIVGEVPLPRLRHAIAAYPTRSEIWLKLLEKYEAA